MNDREVARIEARIELILTKLEDVVNILEDENLDDEERCKRIHYITDRLVRKYKYKQRFL